MPYRIALVEPYQPVTGHVTTPPLGLLYLAGSLRARLGDRIDISLIDAKLQCMKPEEVVRHLDGFDVVGLSALSYEAPACREISSLVKERSPSTIVVLGGPYTHNRSGEILEGYPHVDWVFDGESEFSFSECIARQIEGNPLEGIPGLYRRASAGIIHPLGTDSIKDLDALPHPAWDLVDFEAYKHAPNMNSWMKGNLYAPLFTSRGCPYECAYCHDIFGKRFRWRSAENVVEEIVLLHEQYGVDEFQIVDDIFNLHKPRLKEIFQLLENRFGPTRFHFCFPNGVRGDILDEEVVAALKRGGAYQVTIAVETVTERLQAYVGKNLGIEKVKSIIEICHRYGIIVRGFFMVGFPTETPREILSTLFFAIRSKLTFAGFFIVVPQKGTPLYSLAMQEGPEALEALSDGGYYESKSWYELTHRFPLGLVVGLSYVAFFLSPGRLLRLLREVGWRQNLLGIMYLVDIVIRRSRLQKALAWLRARTTGV